MPMQDYLVCLPEGQQQDHEAALGSDYLFEDGTRLFVQMQVVWCYQCRKFTDAEYIPTLEKFAETEAFFARPDEISASLAEDFARRPAWLTGRIAPPKCLVCGSTDFLVLPFREDIPSPRSEGTVRLDNSGMIYSMDGFDYYNWLFTPEGDRIYQ